MPTEHSNVMGGSTAAQRINCPGSYKLEKAMPEKGSSEFAERGSMLHAAMELMVVADPIEDAELEKFCDDLLGQTFGFDTDPINQELINTKIIPAWNAWNRVVKEYELDDWFIEQKLSYGDVVPGAFGTADILAIDKQRRLHILDWKFGDGVVVPAEGNMGLGFYAGAALYDTDEEVQEMFEEITGVVLHIVQPRAGYPDEDPLHTWETTEEWVEDLVDMAAKAIELANSEKPPVKPGSWCRWCSAKATCPAQKNLAADALSNTPDTMDGVELGKLMAMADQLKPWIAHVYELAQEELEKGAAIPGYKLVNKRASRVYTDQEQVEKRLRGAKVPVGKSHTKKLLTPAQLQKQVPAKFYKKLEADGLVVMHSSGVTVVPETDKREAVTSSVALLANALPPGDKTETETEK